MGVVRGEPDEFVYNIKYTKMSVGEVENLKFKVMISRKFKPHVVPTHTNNHTEVDYIFKRG